MTDRVEKHIDLAAPVETVWRALTDAEAFGQWFGVALDGPFIVGRPSRGRFTMTGFEHLVWQAQVVSIEPPSRFSFTWHPYAVDPDVDYSDEPSTLIEFSLSATPTGSRLVVVESGFDALPEHRRDEAWRMNDRGWTMQLDNIKTHVGG